MVLLEQDICGGGPSGRNGGFVNSFWNDLDALAEDFGDEAALRACRLGEESVDAIGAFCDEHAIDAWFRKDGDINAAASDAQVGAWADLIITADRLGVGDHFQVLGPRGAAGAGGLPHVPRGVFTPFGATVQPATPRARHPTGRAGGGRPHLRRQPRHALRHGYALAWPRPRAARSRPAPP